MGAHFGRLGNDSGVNVLYEKTVFLQKLTHVCKQLQGGYPFVSRICVRKMLSDISQRGRTEQGVHNCVEQHIRIRMSQKPLLPGNLHSSHNQLSSGGKSVHVISHSYPHNKISPLLSLTGIMIPIIAYIMNDHPFFQELCIEKNSHCRLSGTDHQLRNRLWSSGRMSHRLPACA